MLICLFLVRDVEIVDTAVAVSLGLLVVLIIGVVILAKIKRPPEADEPEILSMNTLAAMPRRPERGSVVFKTGLECPRCRTYLGDDAATMKRCCPKCKVYLVPPKGF